MRKLHSSTASHIDDKYTKENCIFPPLLTSAYNSSLIILMSVHLIQSLQFCKFNHSVQI